AAGAGPLRAPSPRRRVEHRGGPVLVLLRGGTRPGTPPYLPQRRGRVMPVDVPVSPSLVTEAFEDSVSTSQFNAPEGSLIVAAWAGMFEVDEISGGNLTWTERVVSVDIRTMIFTATVPTARNLRVTASGDFFIQGGL